MTEAAKPVFVFSAILGGYVRADNIDLTDSKKITDMIMEPVDFGGPRRSAQLQFYPYIVNVSPLIKEKSVDTLEESEDLKANTGKSSMPEVLAKEITFSLERTEEEKIRSAFEFMKINAEQFAASMGPDRKPLLPWSRLLYIDSLGELSNSHFGDESESVPVKAEEMYLAEPEIVTSSGRKVPKRNPKAKAWVSPYGGKRK